MDEGLDIIRGCRPAVYFEYHGEVFDLPPVKIAPVPSDPIPVLIGATPDASLRRAARRGTAGCTGAGVPAACRPAGPARRVSGGRRARGGRPFESARISMDAFSVAGCAKLAEQGVTDVIVGFRWPYEAAPIPSRWPRRSHALRRFADRVIARPGARE